MTSKLIRNYLTVAEYLMQEQGISSQLSQVCTMTFLAGVMSATENYTRWCEVTIIGIQQTARIRILLSNRAL